MNDHMIPLKKPGNIDPNFLSRLKELGGEKLVSDLINMYLVRSAQLLDTVSHGMASRDLEVIQSASHSLISSAGNLGGKLVSDLSKSIEHAAIEAEEENLIKLFPELESAQTAFLKYLKSALEDL